MQYRSIYEEINTLQSSDECFVDNDLFCGIIVYSATGVNLIGLYNGLDSNVSLEVNKVRYDPSGRPHIGINIPLPCTVNVTVKKVAYRIDIYEPGTEGYPEADSDCSCSCPADKVCVRAKVSKGRIGDIDDMYDDNTQCTCVSKSIWFLKAGDHANQWQKVMLLVGPQDKTGDRRLPFKFGIAAWTATSDPWQGNDFMTDARRDSVTGAPQVKFDKRPTEFRGKTKTLRLTSVPGAGGMGWRTIAPS